MKNIAVIGTGYVGLVTGVCLSDIGHYVTCIDVDERKIEKLKLGISPIYEPGLEKLMIKNINKKRLRFIKDADQGLQGAEVIFIAVGTPQLEGGAVDLKYVKEVAKQIATYIRTDVVVVTKSTVPVGTNDLIKEIIYANLKKDVQVDIVSNPEFLREGSAIMDTFQGDRIVIGAENDRAVSILEEIVKPFGIPIFKTDIRSAEMIKYAANSFLATKISFINEIASICEKVGANVEDVAFGVGQDSRIGSQFFKAGIGYGGSCFPKDTNALYQLAASIDHSFQLLKSVIDVNQKQQILLVDKAIKRFGSLKGKKCTILGLAFKPNTDDMRDAASIVIANQLIKEGATVNAYDPVAMEKAREVLPSEVCLKDSLEESISGVDLVFIVTEWNEFLDFPLQKFVELMEKPTIFDGRNCYSLEEMGKYPIEYHSVGRKCLKGLA